MTCVLGMAQCLLSVALLSSSSVAGSSSQNEENLQLALEYIQSGTSLPSVQHEDQLRLQQFALEAASKMSRTGSGYPTLVLAWLSHALRVYRQYAQSTAPECQAANNQLYENHLTIASNCLLLQLEIQIAQKDTAAAERTVEEHEQLDRQHSMHRSLKGGNMRSSSSSSSNSSSSSLSSSSSSSSSSLTQRMKISTRDRWNQASLNIAVQRKDIHGAKTCLQTAIQYAKQTSSPTTQPNEETITKATARTTAPIVGKRLRRLLDMATSFAHLNGWSTEALMPFMELAGAATSHLRVLDGPQDDDRTYQQQEQQRQTVYLDVVRRVMSELVNQYRCHGVNVTIQLLQVYASIDGSPISGRGRKILMSILAEYGTLLYHNQRWADGQTIMTVLLATMNECTSSVVEGTIDQTSIESAHHLLAEMLSFQEQHDQAMEQSALSGDSFDAHNLRFRLLLRKLQSATSANRCGDSDSVDAADAVDAAVDRGDSGGDDEVHRIRSRQQEKDTTYEMLMLAAQKCMSCEDITDRGILSIAHALQKKEKILPKLRHILCDVLTRAARLIATKAHVLKGSIIRGQIFSNLMSLESQMTDHDERLQHVASTMKQLFISLKKNCDVQPIDDEDNNNGSDHYMGGDGIEIGGGGGIGTFIRVNDLRTCLRSALAAAHASYCSETLPDAPQAVHPREGRQAANVASGDMRLTLMASVYGHIHSIQQLTKYEELSPSRIHIISANLSLRRDIYNQDDVRRHLKYATEALTQSRSTTTTSASSVVSTTTEEEVSVLECMIATATFALCARNNLPESETPVMDLLEKFSKKSTLAAANGFFDNLADEAYKCTSSSRVPMRALSYELECRRSHSTNGDIDSSRGCSSSSSSSGSGSNSKNDPRCLIQIAQCFRRLVDMCLDNDQKSKLLEDALSYSQGSSDSGGSGGSGDSRHGVGYPEDELRWLMVTAWNSGLSCMKVGDHGHGERYLGVSIRFGQMNVAGTGGKRKIAADDEMADMVEYYTSNNFISGRGRQISSGKQHSP